MGYGIDVLRRAAMIAAVVALGACASDGLVGPKGEALAGTWRWVESTGGIAGMRIEPGAEHPEVGITIEEDGAIEVMRGGERVGTVEYRAMPAEGGEDEIELVYEEPLDVFDFDPRIAEQRARFVHADTLVLADPCCDRYSHTFVRVK